MRVSKNIADMDARALAFGPTFALVLCPYSLITYMSGPDDASRMLAAVRGVLAAGASVVVDAFIPRPIPSDAEFSIDYRRDHHKGELTRSKRIVSIAPHVNRIERRYELAGAGGQILERIDTSDDVRTFAPEDLLSLLRESGLAIGQQWWDYVERDRPEGAQYFTVSASNAS
jgi:hypothetical protein